MTAETPDHRFSAADVCAVVVTHHPDPDFPSRLQRVVPQVGSTVIVDNGSSTDAVTMLLAAATSPTVTVLRQSENLGLAQALNAGVRHAMTAGLRWVLLLDQDTHVDADMVDTLLAVHASLDAADAQRTAIIGSRFRDTHARPAESLPLDARGELWQEVESAITSGTLLSLDAFAAIGPFREEFFIDYVDTEYCLRARSAGYRVIETRRPLMSHTVGAPSRHRWLWSKKWTTNHSAERRYYIARNNTVLLREYRTSAKGSWRWKSVVRSFRLCKRILLFERDKLAKIVAVVQGWSDGVRGNLGPRGRIGRGRRR